MAHAIRVENFRYLSALRHTVPNAKRFYLRFGKRYRGPGKTDDIDGKPPSVCAFLLYEFLDTPYEKAAIFALEREIGCFCFIIGHIIGCRDPPYNQVFRFKI